MNLMLKKMRESAGLTQQQVADDLGLKVATYRTWEQGSVKITLENACKCSEVLSCTPNDICGWYIDHPEDRPAPPGDPGAAELVGCYRSCTPERQDALLNLARDSALLSGPAAERGAVSEAV